MRQSHTVIQHKRTVFVGLRVVWEVETFYRQILQRHIGIRSNRIGDGIFGFGAILCYNGDTPFPVCQLTEEEHLRLVGGLVGQYRIRATRLQFIGIMERGGIKSVYQLTVRINSLQGFVAQRLAGEDDTVGRLVMIGVAHVNPCYIVFPENLRLLRIGFLHGCHGRQFFLIFSRIVHGRRMEVRQRLTVDLNIFQAHRSSGRRDHLDRVSIGFALLGFYLDGGGTGTVRCGDRHLLTGCFLHRDLGATFGRHLVGIIQRIFAETLERLTGDEDIIKEGILGNAHDEGDGIFAFCAALGGHRDDLHAVLKNTKHALRLFVFLEGHGRNGAHTLRQRIGILQYFGVEAFHGFAVDIEHFQFQVVRCSHREVDDIGTTCSALRTNGDLIVSVQAFEATGCSGLELIALQVIRHLRQRRGTLLEVDPILLFLAGEAVYQLPAYIQRFQRVVAVGLHGERDLINGCTAVAGCYHQSRFAVQAGRGQRDRLILVALRPSDCRHLRRTYRQRIYIGRHVRTETGYRMTVDENRFQR